MHLLIGETRISILTNSFNQSLFVYKEKKIRPLFFFFPKHRNIHMNFYEDYQKTFFY